MNEQEKQEWAKAIKAGNVGFFRLDSIKGEIESEADHEERSKNYEPISVTPNKIKIYYATDTKRGIEHFMAFNLSIRGEIYRVYKFYKRPRINRIITRTKYRVKMCP